MLADPAETALDTGPRTSASGVERFCAATRTVKPVDDMIRFVLGPDGVTPDLKRKLPGRGLWITASKSVLAEAVARKVFARGFKREVRIAPDLPELTERLLVRSALDALAIAGKAGYTVAGFAKVEAALTRDKVIALIHGSDARPDGVAKLAGFRTHRGGDRVRFCRIGFGIGAVKCGTCCPVGRAGEQYVSGTISPP
jgi:uncharacterized protein